MRGTADKISAAKSLLQSVDGDRQVSAANTSTKVRPRTGRNLAAGLGLGLILALVIVGIIEALDTRVRRSEEVGEVLGLPLLSRIPTPNRNQKGRLAMIDDDDQHYSEAYRKLRVNLDFANIRQAAKKVLVTSALEQEGKSTTVANLAVAMARAGRHVVLVDLDLRAPSLHTFFGLGGSAGLTEIALDHVHLEDALYHVPIVGASGRLDVVPVGSIPPRPADFLESPAIDAVLSELEERADVVLIDSAPLLPVSDSIALSSKVDALVVVVAAGLKRNVMVELQRALGACQAPCLGFVLTGAERETDDYYGGYGRYGGGGVPRSRRQAPITERSASPRKAGSRAAPRRRQGPGSRTELALGRDDPAVGRLGACAQRVQRRRVVGAADRVLETTALLRRPRDPVGRNSGDRTLGLSVHERLQIGASDHSGAVRCDRAAETRLTRALVDHAIDLGHRLAGVLEHPEVRPVSPVQRMDRRPEVAGHLLEGRDQTFRAGTTPRVRGTVHRRSARWGPRSPASGSPAR